MILSKGTTSKDAMDEEDDASVENREQSVSFVNSNLASDDTMEIDDFVASTSALEVILGILTI